jgi:hypothetical protein
MGIDPQARRKAAQRSVDMSSIEEEMEAAVVWRKPDKAERYQQEISTALGERPQSEAQLVMRLVRSVVTDELVEFALIAQKRVASRWVTVVEVDTTHDDECHYHQHGRRAGGRIGDPVRLCPIDCIEDVQDAYNEGYQRLDDGYDMFLERWRRG